MGCRHTPDPRSNARERWTGPAGTRASHPGSAKHSWDQTYMHFFPPHVLQSCNCVLATFTVWSQSLQWSTIRLLWFHTSFICDAFNLFNLFAHKPQFLYPCLFGCVPVLPCWILSARWMNRTLLASTSVVLLMTTLAMTSSGAHSMGVTAGGAWRIGMWVQVDSLGSVQSPALVNYMCSWSY